MKKSALFLTSLLAMTFTLTGCDKDDDSAPEQKVIEKKILEESENRLVFSIVENKNGVHSELDCTFDEQGNCATAILTHIFPTPEAAKAAYEQAEESQRGYQKLAVDDNKMTTDITTAFKGVPKAALKAIYDGIDENSEDYSQYLQMLAKRRAFEKKVLVDTDTRYSFGITMTNGGISSKFIFDFDNKGNCSKADFHLNFPSEEMAQQAYIQAKNSDNLYIGLEVEGTELKMDLSLPFRNMPKSMFELMYSSLDEADGDYSKYMSMGKYIYTVQKSIVEDTAEKFICVISGVNTGITVTISANFDNEGKCSDGTAMIEYPTEEMAQEGLYQIKAAGKINEAKVEGKIIFIDATSIYKGMTRDQAKAMYEEVNENTMESFILMFLR